jgi:quercetin dioxygenase-like cupin family protein
MMTSGATMKTKIHPARVLSGNYDLRPLQTVHLDGAQAAQTGTVRIGEGTRSPPEGLRTSARHEIAYVIAGRARIDTAEGSTIVGAGDVVVSSPTEPHATTALEDTTVFYILIDPPGA